MMLQKKTNLGTLIVRYKQEKEYPGFYVDLKENGKGDLTAICNVEYDITKNCIQVVVYGDVDSDEPTEIVEIDINKVRE